MSTNILDKHASYSAYTARWTRCRDAVSGQDAIHAGGETYLPRLDKQTDEQYDSYRSRARYFNASDRTVRGMVGLVMRKDPSVEPQGTVLEEDISHAGVSLSEYCQDVLSELLTVGRAGTLLDYPRTEGPRTVAQAEAAGETPMWAFYSAENILNWDFTYVNNVFQLTRVVLFDGVEIVGDDQTWMYRELSLEDGVYIQRIYHATGQGVEPLLVSEVIPKRNGSSMSSLPFVFHTISARQHVVDKPPLLDLFNANITHYQVKADHLHALHYVALPTPWVAGVDEKDAPSTIGPQKIWALPDSEARVGLLEFTGAGVSSIRDELTDIETSMAQLGSRLLEPETNVDETATATAIKSMAENSTLSGIVRSLNKQLSKLWVDTLDWAGQPTAEATVRMNSDFLPSKLQGAELTALVSAWQSGAFSKETLFYNLQQGEVVAADVTFEEEEDRIDAEAPEGGAVGALGAQDLIDVVDNAAAAAEPGSTDNES